jgi:hypothetical protein
MPADRPARLVYNASLAWYSRSECSDHRVAAVPASEGWEVWRHPSAEHGLLPWPAQLKCDLYTTGLDHHWRSSDAVAQLAPGQWQRIVRKAVSEREAARWWRTVDDDQKPLLRTYRILKSPTLQLEAYLRVPHGGWNDRVRLGRCALTRLRCGVNELELHQGRSRRLPVVERRCPLCGDAVETEQHFLLECSEYQPRRLQLFAQLEQLAHTPRSDGAARAAGSAFRVHQLPPSQQLRLLLGCGTPFLRRRNAAAVAHKIVLLGVADMLRQRQTALAELAQLRHTLLASSAPKEPELS